MDATESRKDPGPGGGAGGAGLFTATVTLAPPDFFFLVHVRLKVFESDRPLNVSVPAVGLVPDHAPEAEQAVAFTLDQLIVTDPPGFALVGVAEIVTVGFDFFFDFSMLEATRA